MNASTHPSAAVKISICQVNASIKLSVTNYQVGLRVLVMASPSNRFIAIYGPKLIGVSFVAGPDLKPLAITIISVWYIETFIAEDTNLCDGTSCGPLDAPTLYNCPRLVLSVEYGISLENDMCTIVVSACLNEGSKAGYNECQLRLQHAHHDMYD